MSADLTVAAQKQQPNNKKTALYLTNESSSRIFSLCSAKTRPTEKKESDH